MTRGFEGVDVGLFLHSDVMPRKSFLCKVCEVCKLLSRCSGTREMKWMQGISFEKGSWNKVIELVLAGQEL